MDPVTECDVLIAGASFAGALLARQLRLRQPHLKIVQLEKKTGFDYWVGESTLELWEIYASQMLGLGPYLEKHHIMKHGLRFFFDSPQADLPIQELSEVGRRWMFGIPARQLDRAVFDRDLCQMNRELGVDLRMGVGVEKIELGERRHTVHSDAGVFSCRWFIDAAGRASPLERQGISKVMVDDPRHPVASYWGRYRNVRSIDAVGDEAWRRRVAYSPRSSSTCHFMYKGYWIWLIPVTDQIVSIGVAFNRQMHPRVLRNADELTAFLREHACLRELLGPAPEAIDFHGLKQLTRRAERTFSADRWCHTGMSGTFVDPLFSGTCSQIAFNNLMIESLIELDTTRPERLKHAALHYSLMMRVMYESTLRDQAAHRRVGSWEAFIPLYWSSLHNMYNVTVPDMYNQLRNIKALVASHDDDCGCEIEPVVEFICEHGEDGLRRRWSQEFSDYLDQRGLFRRRNQGLFFENFHPPVFIEKMLTSDPDVERAQAQKLLAWMHRYLMRAMADVEGIPFDEAAAHEAFEVAYLSFQQDPTVQPTLAAGLELMRKRARGTAPPTPNDEASRLIAADLRKFWP